MKPRTPSLAALFILVAILLVSGCERGTFVPWQCSDPAFLEGEWDPRLPDQYGVKIADGLDNEQAAEEFEIEPGIEVSRVSTGTNWIWVTMNPLQREILRCDPRVVHVIHSRFIDCC